MKNIRVASVQFQHAPGNKPANLHKIPAFVEQAAAQHVALIAFPEMCITGYWHVRTLSRDEVRTGNAMILDPYGEILVSTRTAADAMVIADLDADVLPTSSGRRWLQARRPKLYAPLCTPIGNERNTHSVRFKG